MFDLPLMNDPVLYFRVHQDTSNALFNEQPEKETSLNLKRLNINPKIEEAMTLTKHFIFLSIVMFTCVFGWSGCYTQLATNSDNPGPVNNSPADVVDQPPPATVIIIDPMADPTTEQYYPHPWYPPVSAGSTSTGAGSDSPAESPHRQSGYQRSPSTEQSNSRQADATPPRNSWSPAPASAPNAPPPSSDSGTRTSGTTRQGR
jgi:hypothetical protein